MRKIAMIGMFLAGSAAAFMGQANAAEAYKIGISAGLTGYVATIDRAWSDAVKLAADHLNAQGGIMGRQIEVVVEDNKSEPQAAVTSYKKMISSDQVDIFVSGCVSAGNFAAAGNVVRAKLPMVLCSILPTQPDHLKWAFTMIPPPRFEVEVRLKYLQDKTQIKKIGVIYDPSPYATVQKTIAEKSAANFGLEVVGIEQYKHDEPDLSAQINKLKSEGAQAILKMGVGGTTLTAAKNIKQLGLDMLMLTSLEDVAVLKPVGDVLGDKFFFVASPAQVYQALPEGALKAEIDQFLKPWRAKFGDRDPNWAGRGWDGVMLIKRAIENAKSFEGPKVRDAIEKIAGFQGTTGIYNFSPENHQGLTENPLYLAQFKGGVATLAQ